MLEKAFNDVYTKFKLHFYQNVFQRFATREATLTTVESFCMEGIMAMGEPTIAEFSRMMGISTPNAAYKIGSLVKKGDTYYITYKETQTIGFEGCTTTIKIAEDGSRVALLRFGRANSQLLIERDRRNLCHYETEVGSLTLGVTGDGIDCKLTEKGGSAAFSYLLDADDARIVSRNTLEMTVQHVN